MEVALLDVDCGVVYGLQAKVALRVNFKQPQSFLPLETYRSSTHHLLISSLIIFDVPLGSIRVVAVHRRKLSSVALQTSDT